MKYLITIFVLTISSMLYSQVTLIDESFDSELPPSWSHCSGNWGEFQQWYTEDGLLREFSGPYFGRVLNGLLLPSINLNGIKDPILEFEYALGEIDSLIQLSVYYTSSDSCSTVWDTLNGGYLLENWNKISDFNKTNDIDSNDWIPDSVDYVSIQMELDSVLVDSTIRIGIVSDYKNYFASGNWYIRSLKLYGTSTTSTFEQNIENSSVELFPNPATETLNVITEVVDTSGQLIHSSQLNGTTDEINVSDYSKGMYFLQCAISGSVITRKFVVE